MVVVGKQLCKQVDEVTTTLLETEAELYITQQRPNPLTPKQI